ncbi:hypothetical protein BGW38_005331 [Lunasporangiospora selenospora]|uniref:Vacuolar ATPase assembly protein VMA22 n=1 Tax=Lunasporangiospora selenospora TaxID=979761 RepID=A0A9P6G0B7_9FUNG|nr:hypothetical protein BGW38_005331 [Lunasporangiospora selenospora]
MTSTDHHQELDVLVLEYMALVDEHLVAWDRIASLFQQGHEQISEAKYTMGPRNVSAECYDLRMTAIHGIERRGATEVSLRNLYEERLLQEKDEAAAEDAQDSKAEGVRNRQRPNRDNDQDTNQVSASSESKESEEKVSSASSTGSSTKKPRKPDPLFWFGAFAPRSLRMAQTSFQKSLSEVVEMATIQAKLFDLEQRIKSLRQQN